MAFVLGAGIGSILHIFFMVCLISVRHCRGGGASRVERRAARKARRAARREGRVRLEGENAVQEVLPSYDDDAVAKLDEKA